MCNSTTTVAVATATAAYKYYLLLPTISKMIFDEFGSSTYKRFISFYYNKEKSFN